MFLTRRKNSQNWQLEIKFPAAFEFPSHIHAAFFNGRKHFTKTLGTADRQEAEILAAEYIHQFRIATYLWRKGREAQKFTNQLQYADGLHTIDGKQAFVSGREILFLDADGRPAGKGINPPLLKATLSLVDDHKTAEAFLFFDPQARQTELPAKFMPKPSNQDDGLIEAYIRDKQLRPRIADEARSTWEIYKKVIGKPVAKATRKDGKELVAHLFGLGLARATVQKKVGWLAAAVTHAMDEGETKISVNPFSKVLPPSKRGDSEKREPLSEEHMAICWKNLRKLSKEDQLLWKLLAKTGMRLGEAMSIETEQKERGTNIRYVEVGTKTESSERGVPIPLDIGMPSEISGKLFSGSTPAASKRLNRFIKDCLKDAEEKNLVVHSLRHRMADVLRHNLRPHPDVGKRLMGHAAGDVHGDYGKSPMSVLKDLVDRNPIDGTLEE